MRIVFALATCLVLSIAGCGTNGKLSEPPGGGGSPEAIQITHANHGCLDTRDGDVVLSCDDPILKDFTYDGNTLTLVVWFTANCCPEFKTTGSVEGNTIKIELVDELAGCRCICAYENDFSFDWTTPGPVEIAFRSWPKYPRGCVSSLDTLIVLPERQ
jgi:predicted small lipoprotein YifL